MSEAKSNDPVSAIKGGQYGSSHNWESGYTGPARATPYRCRQCGDGFNHHYPSTPNIFQAMKESGHVSEKCPAVSEPATHD